jgi:hypothetical protein
MNHITLLTAACAAGAAGAAAAGLAGAQERVKDGLVAPSWATA